MYHFPVAIDPAKSFGDTNAHVVGAYGLSGTLSIPSRYLIPLLMLFSIVGAFALRNAAFDVFLMLGAGAFGYLLKRTGYSPAAVVMGVILASIADNELIRMFQLYGLVPLILPSPVCRIDPCPLRRHVCLEHRITVAWATPASQRTGSDRRLGSYRHAGRCHRPSDSSDPKDAGSGGMRTSLIKTLGKD